jgi:adenylate cyclase
VECQPDQDGIYRRVPLVVPFQGRWLPLLGFAAWQAGRPAEPLRFEEGALLAGSRRIPLDRDGQFLLKFRGPSRSHQRFSAVNLIQSDYRQRHDLPPLVSPQALAGKYVLMGLTAPGLLDLKASPVSAVYPGVEVHATLLDNLLQGDFLRPLPGAPWWAWTLALTALMVFTVLFCPSLAAGLGVMAALNLLNLGLCVLAFRFSWWADPVLPAFALNLGFAVAEAYSYATEGRQKLAIRRMFSQYMSEVVISHLIQHPEKLKLGGERRRVTLFFSDLAGFTTISEHLDPETLVALLNDYLSRMTEIILDEAGTVDKFEGDAIMAFWGAPLDQEDQALRACCAALRQQEALPELNRYLAGVNLPPLRMRIGLNTGEAIVGNLGSQKRFDYTVIGDTVNLASRLEGLNKFYGTHLMASGATVQECGEEVEFRELDWVAVKGKEKPVTVFEVLARKGNLTPAQAAAREAFAQGLRFYRAGRFLPASQAFNTVAEQLPGDGPARVFLERCRQFQAAPPPSGWDAVFRPEGK